MIGLRNALIAMAFLSSVAFGLGTAMVINDEGWSRLAVKLHLLGLIGTCIVVFTIWTLIKRGIVK